MLLEAGAGTGKTTTMVARLVEAIRQGQPARGQVAVTFTVKAAWEILDRLRKSLETADTEACRRAIREVSSMRVGTIDSVIQRLLEEYPLEAGVAAGFRILSETEFLDRFDAWFDGAYRQWTHDAALNPAWDGLECLDVPLRASHLQLRDLAMRVARSGKEPTVQGAEFDGPATLRQWEADVVRPLEGEIEGNAVFVQAAFVYLEQLRANEALVREDPFAPISKPDSLGNKGGGGAMDLRDSLKGALAELMLIAERGRFRVVAPLFQRAVADASAHATGLLRQGLLGFDQALHLATELLKNHPDVRARTQAEVSGVMVDEFQDTSPGQVELIRLLSADGRIPLFAVGDPKQSIYRFRGADLDGYLAFRADAPALDMATGDLTANFRSLPVVLDLVNRVFEPRFQVAEGLGYRPLDAHCAADAVAGHACVVGGMCESADESRAAEVGTAVGAIAQAITAPWQVREPGGGPVRALRFCDVAVLYRARSVLPALTAALTASHISFRIEGESDVLDTDEVRAVVSVLRVATRTNADDPDQVAIDEVAAMASLAGGRLSSELRASERWGEAEGALRRELPSLPPSQAVRRVIEALELDSLTGGHRRPRAVLNRLHCLTDRAMAAEAEGIVTLRGFVDLIDAAQRPDLNESPAPEDDEDSVRLMTVHAAKGLEFPMVILVGFSGQARHPPDVLWTPEGDVWIKVGNSKGGVARPGGMEAAESAEKAAEEGEGDRLLYVGMTRARDHLIVSASRHPRSAPVLAKLDQVDLEENRTELEAPLPLPLREFVFDAPDTAGIRERWAALDKREPRTTPTRLSHAERDNDGFEQDDRDDEVAAEDAFIASPAAKSSTAFGRAVHLAMQTVDLRRPDVEGVSRAAASLYGSDADRVAAYVARALESAPLRGAACAARVLREVYGASPLGEDPNCLLEGIVDLVYELPDGTLVAVDYKTDRIGGPEDVERKMDGGYRRQGTAYRELLEAVTGHPVSAVWFVFLGVSPAEVRDALSGQYSK